MRGAECAVRGALVGYHLRMRHKFLACAFGVLLATGSLLADTRIEFKTTEGTGGDMTSVLIAQGKIRTEAGSNTSIIIDPGAGVMTLIDHSKKTFTKLTKADIDAFAKQLEDMMAQIPPEMRQMMASRMGGAGGASVVDFQPTGESSTVAGKPCKVYKTTMMGKVTSESCLADASVIDIPAADRATMQAAMAWAKQMTEQLSKGPLGRMGGSIPFRTGLVPVRSTTFDSNGARNTSELTGVSTAPIGADAFAIPAGYKEQKVEMPKIGRGGGAGR